MLHLPSPNRHQRMATLIIECSMTLSSCFLETLEPNSASLYWLHGRCKPSIHLRCRFTTDLLTREIFGTTSLDQDLQQAGPDTHIASIIAAREGDENASASNGTAIDKSAQKAARKERQQQERHHRQELERNAALEKEREQIAQTQKSAKVQVSPNT